MAEKRENEEKVSGVTSVAKVRNIVITVAICLLLVSSIINFVSKLVKYNELKKEEEQKLLQIYQAKERIEELKYWIDAPMDDDYVMKFAREKLDLFRADEIVFTNDQEN